MILYTDNDPFCCAVLRARVADGSLPCGDVLEADVRELDDLSRYRQIHLFAGIGGFGLAQKWSGWPDEWSLVTGGPPCQPTSIAGAQRGEADPRYLWPEMARLVAARRPTFVFYENPPGTPELAIDRVLLDLEIQGYRVRAFVVPACAVNAPHKRDRVWIVANADQPLASQGRQQRGGQFGRVGGDQASGYVEHSPGFGRREGRTQSELGRRRHTLTGAGFWDNAEWLCGADKKRRRVKPGVRLLAHGIPGRVGKLRALGNAIVPQVATAIMDCVIQTHAHIPN